MKVTVRIQELMNGRSMGVTELARELGVDEATAQSLAEGRSTEIEMPVLSRLAEIFNVTPPEIVAGVEEPQPSVEDAPMPRSLPEERLHPIRDSGDDVPSNQQPEPGL